MEEGPNRSGARRRNGFGIELANRLATSGANPRADHANVRAIPPTEVEKEFRPMRQQLVSVLTTHNPAIQHVLSEHLIKRLKQSKRLGVSNLGETIEQYNGTGECVGLPKDASVIRKHPLDDLNCIVGSHWF